LKSETADVNLQGATYADEQRISAQNAIHLAETASAITAGRLSLAAQALQNAGKISTQAATDANLKRLQNQGQIVSGQFKLSSLDSLKNSGAIISDQDLSIAASQLENARGAQIASNQSLVIHLSGQSLNNEGSLSALNQLSVNAQQANVVNSGQLAAGLQLQLDAQQFINNAAVNAGKVQVTAAEIKNTANISGSTVLPIAARFIRLIRSRQAL